MAFDICNKKERKEHKGKLIAPSYRKVAKLAVPTGFLSKSFHNF
jgi:hypothetical protein